VNAEDEDVEAGVLAKGVEGELVICGAWRGTRIVGFNCWGAISTSPGRVAAKGLRKKEAEKTSSSSSSAGRGGGSIVASSVQRKCPRDDEVWPWPSSDGSGGKSVVDLSSANSKRGPKLSSGGVGCWCEATTSTSQCG
jgi:hypothetical protein